MICVVENRIQYVSAHRRCAICSTVEDRTPTDFWSWFIYLYYTDIAPPEQMNVAVNGNFLQIEI